MQLLRDAQLWLGGSAGAVKVVFLFELFSPNVDNQIKAMLTDCRVVQNILVLASYVRSSLSYHIPIFLTSY